MRRIWPEKRAWRARCSAAAVLVWIAAAAPGAWASGTEAGADVRVPGPGREPQLFFTCCDKGAGAAEQLLGDPKVIAQLKELHAGIAMALPELDSKRAAMVRGLNAEGIPAIAGIQLPKSGTYINAEDFPQARAAVTAFEAWSQQNGLHWEAVGLDIEPNFGELGRLREHPLTLARLLLSRYFERGRVLRARTEYAGLIRQLQQNGYRVETVQLPLIVAERQTHSTVLERLLGIVDVRGDQEALMLYTSFAPPDVGAGILWALGPDAQAIAVGSTEGPRGLVLNWRDFSQDLLIAAHFTHTVGVYNLEGCVQQGFLARLESMDWNQTASIPATEIRKAQRRVAFACALVWVGTWMPAILAVLLLAIALVWMAPWRRKAPSRRA